MQNDENAITIKFSKSNPDIPIIESKSLTTVQKLTVATILYSEAMEEIKRWCSHAEIEQITENCCAGRRE